MRLAVCLEGELAGHLDTDAAQTRFTYTDTWLETVGSYPLSASLPLQTQPLTGASVVNFLWGLLPDNERMLDAWARQWDAPCVRCLHLWWTASRGKARWF